LQDDWEHDPVNDAGPSRLPKPRGADRQRDQHPIRRSRKAQYCHIEMAEMRKASIAREPPLGLPAPPRATIP